MTEPVAYLNRYQDESTNITRYKTENNHLLSSRPLYTSDQLCKRVKMTQAEFDEFNRLYSQGLLFSEAMEMLGTQGESERYVNIRNRIYTQYIRENMDSEVIFAQLWQLYNSKHPEETIEIVPDFKWFVRSKEKSNGNEFWYLKKTEHFFFHEYIKEISTQFDTKEEAEKWVNPLTEAVQLPVDGE